MTEPLINPELIQRILKVVAKSDNPEECYDEIVDKISDIIVCELVSGKTLNTIMSPDIHNFMCVIKTLIDNYSNCIALAGIHNIDHDMYIVIRDNWDRLVQTGKLLKLGCEGWRECRDLGPSQNAVYAIDPKYSFENYKNIKPTADEFKDLKGMNFDKNQKEKELEKEVDKIETEFKARVKEEEKAKKLKQIAGLLNEILEPSESNETSK